MAEPALLLLSAVLAGAAPSVSADFVTVRNSVVVERPIDQVWTRIGGWCAIADWLQVKCDASAGPADVGSIRTLNGVTVEVMVARTAHSYVYWQTKGNMAAYSYHGSLSAEPIGTGRTRLVYTLLYDQAGMPSGAVRASERQRLNGRFLGALETMKKLAEAK